MRNTYLQLQGFTLGCFYLVPRSASCRRFYQRVFSHPSSYVSSKSHCKWRHVRSSKIGSSYNVDSIWMRYGVTEESICDGNCKLTTMPHSDIDISQSCWCKTKWLCDEAAPCTTKALSFAYESHTPSIKRIWEQNVQPATLMKPIWPKFTHSRSMVQPCLKQSLKWSLC